MYAFDDILIRPSYNYSENIDYLCNEEDYNLDNLNLVKCMKCSYDERLTNVCWRRIYKNLYNLKEINPFVINWDKNSDITWLFGPKFDQDPEPETQVETEQEQQDILDEPFMSGSYTDVSTYSSDDDVFDCSSDTSSVSSIDSGYFADYSPSTVINPKIKRNIPTTTYDDFYQLKSILKSSGVSKSTPKKVMFNYKINSREIISGMSFDYDYLDEQCL